MFFFLLLESSAARCWGDVQVLMKDSDRVKTRQKYDVFLIQIIKITLLLGRTYTKLLNKVIETVIATQFCIITLLKMNMC